MRGASDSQGILAEASEAAVIDVVKRAAITTLRNSSSGIDALSWSVTEPSEHRLKVDNVRRNECSRPGPRLAQD